MLVLLLISALLAQAYCSVPIPTCSGPYVKKNLVWKNRDWWGGSYTDPSSGTNWQRMLRKSGTGGLVIGPAPGNNGWVHVVLRPDNPFHCFKPFNICWVAYRSSGCSVSISCGDFNHSPSRRRSVAGGCLGASCAVREVRFKCRIGSHNTMRLKIKSSDVRGNP